MTLTVEFGTSSERGTKRALHKRREGGRGCEEPASGLGFAEGANHRAGRVGLTQRVSTFEQLAKEKNPLLAFTIKQLESEGDIHTEREDLITSRGECELRDIIKRAMTFRWV